MPVYKVSGPDGERLVDAKTKQAAINHVVGDSYQVEAVTTSELAALIKSGGMEIETVEARLTESEEEVGNGE